MNAFYPHSRIKQYLEDGHALRNETVINDTHDPGVQRRLHNLPELQTRARAVNHRLLDTERLMTGLLGEPHDMGRAAYDLTRLRRNGLITRVERITPSGAADCVGSVEGCPVEPPPITAHAVPGRIGLPVGLSCRR